MTRQKPEPTPYRRLTFLLVYLMLIASFAMAQFATLTDQAWYGFVLGMAMSGSAVAGMHTYNYQLRRTRRTDPN